MGGGGGQLFSISLLDTEMSCINVIFCYLTSFNIALFSLFNYVSYSTSKETVFQTQLLKVLEFSKHCAIILYVKHYFLKICCPNV